MSKWNLDPREARFFGDIQRGVREGEYGRQLWERIHKAEERLGVTLGPRALLAVNDMVSAAVSLREASKRFARATPNDAITAKMIAGTIYERSPATNVGAANYHVRFSVPRTIGGETSLERYTMAYDGFLPATVGELLDDLNGYAAAMSEEYGGELGDITDIEIGRY